MAEKIDPERAKHFTFTEEDENPFEFSKKNDKLPIVIRDVTGRVLTEDELKERGIL